MFDVIILMLLGMVSGVLAGLLGVGGGIVIVPVLLWFFEIRLKFPLTDIMHIALATSLATIIFTAISSIHAHQKRKTIFWPIVLKLAPGIIVGSFLGALVGSFLTTDTLKNVFGIFLVCVSIQMGFVELSTSNRPTPKWFGTGLMGIIIGQISSLVGIGGGSLTVPFLLWCSIPIRNAIAISAACGLPIAIAGTLSYMVLGRHLNFAWSTGYVYWPSVLAIVPTSLICVPLGTKLAYKLPSKVIKKCFAIYLAIVSIKILFY